MSFAVYVDLRGVDARVPRGRWKPGAARGKKPAARGRFDPASEGEERGHRVRTTLCILPERLRGAAALTCPNRSTRPLHDDTYTLDRVAAGDHAEPRADVGLEVPELRRPGRGVHRDGERPIAQVPGAGVRRDGVADDLGPSFGEHTDEPRVGDAQLRSA